MSSRVRIDASSVDVLISILARIERAAMIVCVNARAAREVLVELTAEPDWRVAESPSWSDADRAALVEHVRACPAGRTNCKACAREIQGIAAQSRLGAYP